MMEKNGNLDWPRSPAARLSTRRRYEGLERGHEGAGLFGKIWQGWREMEVVVKNGGDGKIWKFRLCRPPLGGQIGNIYQYPQAQTKRESFHSPNATAYVFLMVIFTTFGHSVQQKRSFRTNSPIPNSCQILRFLSSYLTVLYLPSIWT